MRNPIKPVAIIFCLLLLLATGLWGLGDALTPLTLSFGLAYLLFPVIKRLEAKGIPRKYSVLGLFTIISIAIALLAILVLPGLVLDGQMLLRELPASSLAAIKKIESISAELGYPLDLSRDSIGETVKNHISTLSGSLLSSLSHGIKSSFTGITNFLISILNLFLIPLFLFYAISDYEKIATEIKSFIPRPLRPKLTHYLKLSDTVLSGYIRGQIMTALALSVLYAIGLSVTGLRFGVLIGLLSGLISIIPYAGFSIGFATAILISLANYSGIPQIFSIIAVYLLVQILEGFIITPKLVGNRVGLGAFATVLALIIGGNLLGFMGMLIAIPVAAIIKSALGELKREYRKLDFFQF